MTLVRLIVAFASVYIYYFVLGKLENLSPLKWFPDNIIAGLITNAIGVVIFSGVLLWPFYKEAKLKTRELKKIATDMGFVFHGGNFHPDPSLLKSPLLQRGYRQRFGPAMTGKHEGVNIQLFEHVYSEPEGASDTGDTRFFRTVVVFHAPEFHIPEFVMLGKSLGDRMFEKIFRSKNIHFEDDSQFSKRYALTGPNQEYVLKLFTPELRSAFTGSKKRWAAAGIDNQLILFTDDTLDEQLKPERFIDYLKKTWEIFEIARSRNSGREIK